MKASQRAAKMQEALAEAQRDKNPSAPASAPAVVANSRKGKTHIGAYLDPAFRKSLRMVQAKTDDDMQALIAQALNDLFRKHNVPVVGQD
jgi:hypothetical protein